FTQRGLGRTGQVKAWPWLDWSLLVGNALIAVLYVSGVALVAHALLGVLFLAVGLWHLLRLIRWYAAGTRNVPLLWSLHLAMLWLVVATVGLALWNFGLLNNSSPSLHALSVGAMGGLILAMIARVTLGHTGRPLELPPGIVWAIVLLNLETPSRVALSAVLPLDSLWLAASYWAAA